MSQSSNIKFIYCFGAFQLQPNEMTPDELRQAILAGANKYSESYELNEDNSFTNTPDLDEVQQAAYEQYREFVETTRAFLRDKKRRLG